MTIDYSLNDLNSDDEIDILSFSDKSIHESIHESSSEVVSTTENNSTETKHLDLKGDIINNYNIIYKIGSGSFSTVWLGYNISDSKYYAIKVQNAEDYQDGKDEIKILKKIGKTNEYVNSINNYFVESQFLESTIEKFACGVFDLCAGNLYNLGRKGIYRYGYPINIVKKCFKQICLGLEKLHNETKIFHGDLKPDNILICGLNNKDKEHIKMYNEANFSELYAEIKKKYWIKKGKDIKNIKKMPTEIKIKIRKKIHQSILNNFKEINESNNLMDNKYFENIQVKITDFGHFCPDDEVMEEDFGTSYYRSPEVVLMGDCRKSVDIWSLGCTLYELITGNILFNPDDDNEDYNHLKLMIELCGNFDESMLRKTKNYQKYFTNGKLNNFKLTDKRDIHEKLKDKLKNKEIQDLDGCIDLLCMMIKLSPTKRSKISDILKHDWLN